MDDEKFPLSHDNEDRAGMILRQPVASGDATAQMMLLSRRDIGRVLSLTGFLLLASVVLLLGAIGQGPIVSSLFIGGALLLCGIALLVPERRDLSLRTALQWFIVAYCLRVSFAVLVHVAATTIDQSPFLFHDETGFYGRTERLLVAWHNGTIFLQSPIWYQRDYWAWLHIVGFTRFVGEILGGDTALNVKLVSCAAGALIVPYVYGMAKTVFDEKVARVAAGFAFLLPDYWLLSATLLRDVLVSCVILVVLYQVLMCTHCRFRWWRLILAMFLNFGLLLYLRSYVSLLVAGISVCCVLWDRTHRSRARRVLLFSAVGVLVTGLVVCLVVLASRVGPYHKLLNAVQAHGLLSRGMDRYTDLAVEKASEDSLGVLFVKLPFYLRVPISTARLLFLPIPPWGPLQTQMYYNFTRVLLETVAGFAWYALLPFLAVGVIATLRYRELATVWIWVPAFAFTLALAANTALMTRWRLMAMPFLLVFVAQGWVLRVQYRQLVGLVVLLLVTLLAAYIVIKYLWPALGAWSLVPSFVPAFMVYLADVLRRKSEGRSLASV